ncbi:MAG: cytidylate kinase [Omnitrophica bacterium RBG_13_46_9]|nr:MAG: cytidylate kinase [Omnitrophica bacterium RBG_13_46_9]
MKTLNVVAIDGPAGSGKSTVAKKVAEKLGFLYIDTGAMYRALTLKAINAGLDFNKKRSLIDLSKNIDIELKESGDSLKVYLDKQDVSEQIRTMEVTTKVKLLASLKEVRANMVRLQRKLGMSAKGVVLEGRDIGTVVFPEARYKFYLDANLETRVKRRFEELKCKGFSVSLDEIKEDVKNRDTADMTRKAGPLKKAEEAVAIDTTDMSVEGVVKEILDSVKADNI